MFFVANCEHSCDNIVICNAKQGSKCIECDSKETSNPLCLRERKHILDSTDPMSILRNWNFSTFSKGNIQSICSFHGATASWPENVIRRKQKSNELFSVFSFQFCSQKVFLVDAAAATCIHRTNWTAPPFFHHLILAFMNGFFQTFFFSSSPDSSPFETFLLIVNDFVSESEEYFAQTLLATRDEKLNIDSTAGRICTTVYWHHFHNADSSTEKKMLNTEMIKNNWG